MVVTFVFTSPLLPYTLNQYQNNWHSTISLQLKPQPAIVQKTSQKALYVLLFTNISMGDQWFMNNSFWNYTLDQPNPRYKTCFLLLLLIEPFHYYDWINLFITTTDQAFLLLRFIRINSSAPSVSLKKVTASHLQQGHFIQYFSP